MNEASGQASLTVLRGITPATDTITVDYATTAGTATAGADYTATSGTLTFGPGETSKTITVPILNDALVEGNETINLSLSNPAGSVLGPQATLALTIQDDDRGIEFASSEVWVNEASGEGSLTVLRGSTPITDTIAVDYATTAGTATAGADYTATSPSRWIQQKSPQDPRR